MKEFEGLFVYIFLKVKIELPESVCYRKLNYKKEERGIGIQVLHMEKVRQ